MRWGQPCLAECFQLRANFTFDGAGPSGRIPVTTVSADWSNTCRQVGSDSRHHSFSRLVQYLPSSRVGFRRTDGPKYFSCHLMAVLSFSRLVQNSPSSRVGFQSPQFQPTGPIYLPSSRVGFRRTDGPTFFVQSPHGSSQFQPTSPKLAFKSGRIPVHTVQADWSKTCRQVGSDSDGLEGIACCCTDLAQGLLGGVSCLLLSRLALEGVL